MNNPEAREFVALLNRVLADKDPGVRIRLAGDLAQGLAKLLFMPVVGLEQLIAALEADSRNAELHAKSALAKMFPHFTKDVIDAMADTALQICALDVATLRLFLKHRPALAADFQALNPNVKLPE